MRQEMITSALRRSRREAATARSHLNTYDIHKNTFALLLQRVFVRNTDSQSHIRRTKTHPVTLWLHHGIGNFLRQPKEEGWGVNVNSAISHRRHTANMTVRRSCGENACRLQRNEAAGVRLVAFCCSAKSCQVSRLASGKAAH